MKVLAERFMHLAAVMMNLASQLGTEENVIQSFQSPEDLEKFIATMEQCENNLTETLANIRLEAIDKYLIMVGKGGIYGDASAAGAKAGAAAGDATGFASGDRTT